MPKYRNSLWWFFWWLLTLLRPLFCRLRLEGRENLPLSSGGVVACNHNYGFDFVYLAYASPRELRFMAKAEAFGWSPLLAAFLRAGGAFPVRRGQGDSAAIDTAVDIVRGGELIAMFPEGTRSRDGALLRGRTGAARIALAANAPVIPVAVINSQAMFKLSKWRPTVTVRFGKPVAWVPGENEAASARAFIDTVMLEIAALLPEGARGYYGPEGEVLETFPPEAQGRRA